ncbi:hypothetical protein Tco_0031945 [Tanacetum coccineum]
MFANMRLNFHGDSMPLLAIMLPPAQPAIAGESSGEAKPTDPHIVPETLTEPAHSHDQASSPPRPTTIPASTTSGGAEDPDKLTALCSLVNSLVQKTDSQASDLKAHKLVFKEVVGKLVKKVKELEDKLQGRKRKVLFLLISLLVLLNAPSDKEIPMLEEEPLVRERSFRQREEDRLGAEAARRLYEEEQAELAREREEQKQKRQKDVLESAKYYTDADWNEIMGQVHANQGLSADLLGPDVNEENFAERMVALIAERRRKFAAQRFQDKRNKPMTYAQQRDYMRTFVKNQSSTIYTTGWTLKHVRSFSDDQLKDEFDKIRHALANLQSQHLRRSLKRQGADLEQPDSKKSKSTEPQKTSVPAASRPLSAGVTPDVHQSPFVDTPPHSPKASSHPDVTPDTSKQPSVAPTPPSGFSATPTVTRTSVPRTRSQSSAAGIKTYSTRRKSLGSRKMSSSEVDLNAADKSFIKVLSDDDSDDSDGDTNPLYWHAFAAWEIVPTGLGDVNALYFADKSSKYFTHLREILHLLDRQDLSKLYGMVVKNYEENPIVAAGMMLWGDIHVLFESVEGGSSVEVWADQKDWVVSSWRIFPFSGVHVLETFSGTVLYMFADTPYPLSASTMKKMLKHKLEVEINGIGNDMTHAEQLIAFIKNRLAALASPEQTATGKDASNPFMAVMTCQKSYSSSTYYDSCSESGKWFQSSMDLTLSGPCLDADFLVADSKYMTVAFGDGFKMLLFNPLVCSTKDLSRNLKLTMSNSSLGEDC